MECASGFCRLVPQAWPTRSVFDVSATPCKRILDGVIAGAAAEVALETEREIFLLFFRKACGCHDHARGAESALERLRIEERLLHRMEVPVGGEPFDGGDFAPFGTKSRHKAAVDGFAVEPDRACAAIAGIAAFFHAEPSEIASEGSQALAGPRLSARKTVR